MTDRNDDWSLRLGNVRPEAEAGLAESLSAGRFGVNVGGAPSTPAERLRQPLWGVSFRLRF